jgi:hypothetical protein
LERLRDHHLGSGGGGTADGQGSESKGEPEDEFMKVHRILLFQKTPR